MKDDVFRWFFIDFIVSTLMRDVQSKGSDDSRTRHSYRPIAVVLNIERCAGACPQSSYYFRTMIVMPKFDDCPMCIETP